MKEKYNKEKEFLKKAENPNNENNKRAILNDEEIKILLEKHPKVPQDYISYLQEIGSGNFRESQFKIHSVLFNLEDLGLEDHFELKSSIWFFGDNYCGDFSGFDFNDESGNVVEFWHESGELHYTNKSFQNYIRTQMLMDEKY